MTDKTLTQNLTRTTATDDPRRFASYLETLRDEVDRKVAAQYYHLNRSANFPAAMVHTGDPFAIRSDDIKPNIIFETVDFDVTGKCVDLATNNKIITLASPGYWHVGGYVAVTGWPTGSGDFLVWLQAGSSIRTLGFHDGNLGFCSGSASVLTSVDYPLTSYAALGAAYSGTLPGGAEGSTLIYAQLWAWKVRDL
jgi:hypothetical protein